MGTELFCVNHVLCSCVSLCLLAVSCHEQFLAPVPEMHVPAPFFLDYFIVIPPPHYPKLSSVPCDGRGVKQLEGMWFILATAHTSIGLNKPLNCILSLSSQNVYENASNWEIVKTSKSLFLSDQNYPSFTRIRAGQLL